jgi:hypothetical protein
MLVEISFAFLVGLTISGMTASSMELATGCPISFKGPYISIQRPAQSLLASAAAGPLMLANDALEAYRGGRVSAAGLAACTVAALAWSTAIGTAVVGLAARAMVSLS